MSGYNLFDARMVQEMNNPNCRLVYAVRIDYTAGVLRTHTGVGDLVIEGYNYLGIGILGEIGEVQQDSKTSPASLNLTVTGLDAGLTATVMNDRNIGTKVWIYLVALDENESYASHSLIFTGRITNQQYGLDKKQMAVEVQVADRLIDWGRKSTDRFSDESHANRRGGDRFFRFVRQMAERAIYWGSKKDGPSFRY